jgi:hypothetical protein
LVEQATTMPHSTAVVRPRITANLPMRAWLRLSRCEGRGASCRTSQWVEYCGRYRNCFPYLAAHPSSFVTSATYTGGTAERPSVGLHPWRCSSDISNRNASIRYAASGDYPSSAAHGRLQCATGSARSTWPAARRRNTWDDRRCSTNYEVPCRAGQNREWRDAARPEGRG